jgi:acetyl esterase/lipase
MGSIDTHKDLVTRITDKTGIQSLFVEYSLAPEHPFPQGFQEIVEVYKELSERLSPNDIVVMGDSAGGQQGLALLLKLKEEEVALPTAYVGLSPAVDITPETLRKDIEQIKGQDPVLSNPDDIIPFLELYYTHYVPSHPFISPIYGDLKGLPPLLIQVSTTEALVFQCEDFAKKAKGVGVTVTLEKYENELHTWQFHDPNSVNSKKSFQNIARFVRTQLQK